MDRDLTSLTFKVYLFRLFILFVNTSRRRSTCSSSSLVNLVEETETDRLYRWFKEYNSLLFNNEVRGFTVQ